MKTRSRGFTMIEMMAVVAVAWVCGYAEAPGKVLLLAAAPARAEWVKVTETGDTVFYVDPASIGDMGNLRQVSVVQESRTQVIPTPV